MGWMEVFLKNSGQVDKRVFQIAQQHSLAVTKLHREELIVVSTFPLLEIPNTNAPIPTMMNEI